MFRVPNHLLLEKRSAAFSTRISHLNKLNETLANKEPYEIVELTNEVMGIDVDDMPDRHEHYRARAKFVDSIKYNFPVGLFTYNRTGTHGQWHVLFRMVMGHDATCTEFIGMCINATKDAPEYLSRRQTKDTIDTVSCASGKNERISKA